MAGDSPPVVTPTPAPGASSSSETSKGGDEAGEKGEEEEDADEDEDEDGDGDRKWSDCAGIGGVKGNYGGRSGRALCCHADCKQCGKDQCMAGNDVSYMRTRTHASTCNDACMHKSEQCMAGDEASRIHKQTHTRTHTHTRERVCV